MISIYIMRVQGKNILILGLKGQFFGPDGTESMNSVEHKGEVNDRQPDP